MIKQAYHCSHLLAKTLLNASHFVKLLSLGIIKVNFASALT